MHVLGLFIVADNGRLFFRLLYAYFFIAKIRFAMIQ